MITRLPRINWVRLTGQDQLKAVIQITNSYLQVKKQIIPTITKMQKGFALNMIEEEQFSNMLSILPKDQKVEELCLKYYLQFKKHQTSIQSDRIVLYLKCAYYLAEKSQWITNINGQKVRNAGLSLNELLKKHSLEDIMITLKQYSKRISIQDPQTLDDVQKLIKQISFLITFYNKFEKVLVKLELKDKNQQYSETLSELVWLLYIQAKNKILNRSLELIDNTCMLAHTLCFVLIYSWDYHQPGYFTKAQNNLQKLTSRKQINPKIHEKILELFLIKNIQSYKNIADRFEAYFSFLKKNAIIKMTPGKDNFLSPEFLQSNYKRIDHFYQKKLDFNHLDERIFFKDRTSNLTPNKFTPFARQKIHIPTKKLGGNIRGLTYRTSQQGNYMSHRILSYENMQSQIQQTTLMDVPPAQIKFPKNIIQTPLNTTTPLIQQTPYTTGIMMYNYVNDLSSRLQKKKFSSRQVDQIIFQVIDEILSQSIQDQNVKSKDIKRNHIFSVYKLIAEDFGLDYPNEVECEQVMKAILLISIQIVFFVSNIDVSFDKLESQIDVSSLSLWRAVDFFLKFDKNMPVNIKVHLLDLQVDIISYKLWKNYEAIANIQNFLSNEKFPLRQVEIVYQKLCKRILHQIAFQITQLCKGTFQRKEQKILISQNSFDIMKQVLLHHPQMIWQNNFDQIIMCAVFSICRAYKLNVKFQNIRQAYLLCNAHLSDQKKLDMFTNIQYESQNAETEGGSKGIIGFYNACFLVVMNQFVKNLCQNFGVNGNSSSRPAKQRTLQQKDVNVLLQSPITGIIPKQVNYEINKINSMVYCGKKIPQMQVKNTNPRLHAYTESPLLKNDIIPVKNPMNSRKVINFEQTQKMLNATTTKKDATNQTKLFQQNAQTSNFFNKKFVTSKPTKLCGQTSSLIKSPSYNNGTKSPKMQHSPSTRMMNDLSVKENGSNLHNVYYTKRDFNGNNGFNLNVNK